MSTPPRWDLTNIYPSLESKEYQAAVKDYKAQVAALGRFFDAKLAKAGQKTPVSKLAALTGEMIDRVNSIQTLSATIGPYLYGFVTTDSHDQVAKRTLSEFEQASRPMDKLIVRFSRGGGQARVGRSQNLVQSG
jgi:oligoendopeptidase F